MTIFDFDREYLRKASTNRKIGKVLVSTTTPSTLDEKIGELWSTNKKVLSDPIDPHKWTFSGDYILAIKGCAPQIFTQEIDLGLLAHTLKGTLVPPPQKKII